MTYFAMKKKGIRLPTDAFFYKVARRFIVTLSKSLYGICACEPYGDETHRIVR